MLIRSMTTNELTRDRRVLKRVMNYGQYKDIRFTVDTFYKDDKAIEKRFVAWADNWQRIVNKFRNERTGKWEKR